MLLWMTIAFCWMTVGWACSCLPHTDIDYCENDVVFLGRPVAKDMENAEIRIYTFEVDEIFWSKSSLVGMRTLNLTTPIHSCGAQFSLNIPFVIAASTWEGRLATGLCSENRDWNSLDKKRKRFLTRRLRKLCV